jgi:TonB family protein
MPAFARAARRFWLLGFAVSLSAQEPGSPARQVLQEGKKLFLQGDYEGARRALRRALGRLEARADRVDARLTLASIHQAQGDDERAVIEFQWAVVEDPGLELDRTLYSPKTLRLFREARQGGVERFLSARQTFLNGRLAEALEEFELAESLLRAQGSGTDLSYVVDASLSSALIHQQLGRVAECKQAFREALALKPDLELDAEIYSPSTMQIFKQVREELTALRGASTARAAYEQLRTRATEAGAEAEASGPFRDALAQAGQAQKKWDQGDFSGAKSDFEQAAAVLERAWPADSVEAADTGEGAASAEPEAAVVPQPEVTPEQPSASPVAIAEEPDSPPLPARIPANSPHAIPIKRVSPVYPAFAVRSRVEGLVILDVLIDREGKPERINPISSAMVFEAAAMRAVKEWRWRPYVLEGEPVAFKVLVSLQFRPSVR